MSLFVDTARIVFTIKHKESILLEVKLRFIQKREIKGISSKCVQNQLVWQCRKR